MKKFLILLLLPSLILAQKPQDNRATNIGRIGLAVNSYGQIGNGFNPSFWPSQPSCEFPIKPVRTRIEHLFNGGLWVGGYGKSGLSVTTATNDRRFSSEFTQPVDQGLYERSSLLESRYYSPDAISHQDFYCDFTDTNTINPLTGEPISGHNPLGVSVHFETYAWQYSIADNFVILNFTIKNVVDVPIESLYVGLVTDLVVRNTNYRFPAEGSVFYSGTGLGYIDSLRLHYAFDAENRPSDGPTDNYIGIKLLGVDPLLGGSLDSLNNYTVYQVWQFRASTGDPDLISPINDQQRYDKMRFPFPAVKISDLKRPGNRYTLLSVGPFPTLQPGDSVKVAFAVICAKKYGTDPQTDDTPLSKKLLIESAMWAQKTYNGEDRNGNGILDPGEDLDGDGKITRFIFPTILPPPKVRVIPGDRKVDIYWDKSVEDVIDPVLNKKDFEGYRIYMTKHGFDIGYVKSGEDPYILLAEFDKPGNDVGFNTGFGTIKLSEPVTFPDDTVKYYYKFTVQNLLNGWQYIFGVEAFDEGDPVNNIPSQSSIRVLKRVVPGSLPTSDKSKEVGVYPNPYYAKAIWDGSGGERERKIYFYNLPRKCEITIYTLAGDIVDRFIHDADTYSGTDIQWFQVYGDGTQKFSGGEHAWDLISKYDQAIATGLYLFTVKDLETGEIKRGKFVIIK